MLRHPSQQGDPMSHRKNLIVGLGVVLLTVLGSVSIAEAQGYPPPYYPPPPPPPPPHGVYRSGLVFGFSGGVGAIHADNCGDACGVAGMVEGHLGGMINPRTALMFEIWGADHPWSDRRQQLRDDQHLLHRRGAVLGQRHRVDQGRPRPGRAPRARQRRLRRLLSSATTSRASRCSAPPGSRSSSPTTSRSTSSSASATVSTARAAAASARRTTALMVGFNWY